MSVQGGVWNFDGKPAERDSLEELSDAVSQYGPDGEMIHLDGPIGILYRPFHTTRESRFERQPLVSSSGLVITWDGRLDNREELMHDLGKKSHDPQTDVEIVAAAYQRWRSACFGKLLGEWACVVWIPEERTLVLASDYVGVRHLYFHRTPHRVIWCKYLAPIVLLSRAPLTLDDEYIAGYLASYARPGLTPYREIQAVPAGCFYTIRTEKAFVQSYWSFEPKRTIRYRTDTEYEEHFRSVFHQAVVRRLRSDAPILGELSGGLDSSSIICMADCIISQGQTETPRLDTISFYDPREPQGDERIYIAAVEANRRRKGHHIDRSKYAYSLFLDYQDFMAEPGPSERAGGLRSGAIELLQTHGYRVVLSGIGGDEMLGGVPNPYPQLADLLFPPRPIHLARQLAAWSLVKKRPWIHLLFQALLFYLPSSLRAIFTPQAKVPPWINSRFARRYHFSVRQLGPQGRYGFWRPSRWDLAQTFEAVRWQLAFSRQHALKFEERRYPYLDQTLIHFLLSIPASQLLRPGERRSLMRRALVGFVPLEILSRRTKGAVARGIVAAFENSWTELESLLSSPRSSLCGYVDQARLRQSVLSAKNGQAPHLVHLVRAIYLELWLRSLAHLGAVQVEGKLPHSTGRLLAHRGA